VQRCQRFFDGSFVVEAVNLVKIDIVCAKTAQAAVNGVHDVLARKAFLVGIVTHGKENLGCDHEFVARWPKIFQGAAQNFFTGSDGVHVGGVKEIDAQFECLLDKRTALFFFQHPLAPALAAVSHAAQTDARNFYPRGAKVGIFHVRLSSVILDNTFRMR
jgi:hypothetical protein